MKIRKLTTINEPLRKLIKILLIKTVKLLRLYSGNFVFLPPTLQNINFIQIIVF